MRTDSPDTVLRGSAPTSAQAAPRQRVALIRRQAGSETLLYDPASDEIHVLNATALAVWELCDGQHSAAQIAERLQTRFSDLPDGDASATVQEALALLEQRGLIVREIADLEV